MSHWCQYQNETDTLRRLPRKQFLEYRVWNKYSQNILKPVEANIDQTTIDWKGRIRRFTEAIRNCSIHHISLEWFSKKKKQVLVCSFMTFISLRERSPFSVDRRKVLGSIAVHSSKWEESVFYFFSFSFTRKRPTTNIWILDSNYTRT